LSINRERERESERERENDSAKMADALKKLLKALVDTRSATIPAALLREYPKFALSTAKPAQFPIYLAAMERALFRSTTSEAAKVEALRSCATGTAQAYILDALEEDSMAFMRSHNFEEADCAEIEASRVRSTPVRNLSYVFRGEGNAPKYVLNYKRLKQRCIAKVLGETALSMLKSEIDALRMGDLSTLPAHEVKFQTILDAYVAAGGPPLGAGGAMYTTFYYASLSDDLKGAMNEFPTVLNDAYKAASEAGRLLERRRAHTPTKPRRSICSFTADQSQPPSQVAQEGTAQLLRALSTADSKKGVMESVCLYSEQVGDRTIDVGEALVDDANGFFNIEHLRDTLSARLPRCLSSYETLAVIREVVPGHFFQETGGDRRPNTMGKTLASPSDRELASYKRHKPEPADESPDSSSASPGGASGLGTNQFLEHAIQSIQRAVTQAVSHAPPHPSPSPPPGMYIPPSRAGNAPMPGSAPPLPPLPPPRSGPPSRHANANTAPNSRTARPWSHVPGWPGCKRCWAEDHKAPMCPPVLTGEVKFCKFCLEDGHELGPIAGPPTCPRLLMTKCRTCNGTGHSSNFCPTQVCSACNTPGHNAVRCSRRGPN
jgi:hypothetical protein